MVSPLLGIAAGLAIDLGTDAVNNIIGAPGQARRAKRRAKRKARKAKRKARRASRKNKRSSVLKSNRKLRRK